MGWFTRCFSDHVRFLLDADEAGATYRQMQSPVQLLQRRYTAEASADHG
jgi:hypothetical protein